MSALIVCAALSQAAPNFQYYGGAYDARGLSGMLGRGDPMGREDKALFDPRMCGSYLVLLTKPTTDKWAAADAFSKLARMPRVHPALPAVAAEWATHDERRVRASLLDFLAAHGGPSQLPVGVALLFDPDPYVCYAAVDAVERIGTPGALAALDIWLARPRHPDSTELKAHVLRQANLLRRRLDK